MFPRFFLSFRCCHLLFSMVSQVRWNPCDEHVLASVSHDGSLKILDIRAPGMATQVVRLHSVEHMRTWTRDSNFETLLMLYTSLHSNRD